jgi:uncharacterized DUF497 family protein
MTRFEWDDAKDRLNRRKHGIGFETAAHVFDDPCALMVQDRTENGEERWQAIGRVGNAVVLLVAHTVRFEDEAEIIRLISARKAQRQERKRYEDQAD